mmetsp:Transcript_45581/g.121197  ORF Transcript_45581/g.121197 Transcript_45581/m.121197 type:complete len:372 (+) Transcript_45581:1171-2286(+)
MVKVEVDVLAVGTAAAALADLDGHRARHDVARGQILCGGGITLHEALAILVAEDTTLTAAALSHQATGTVDAGRMELHELEILQGQAGASNHGIAVTSAGVGAGGREVSAAVSSGGKNGVVGTEAVESAILHAHSHDTPARAVGIHDQIGGEVLNEEHGVEAKSLAVEGVKHRVPSTVSNSGAAVSLTTLAKLEGLTTEGTLVDLALLSTRERHAIVLELNDSARGLTTHVLNSILVAEPVRTLHRVIEVPAPIVLGHIAQSSIDTTLCSYSVRTSGEKLGDASNLEPSLSKTHSRTKTGTTSANNDGIVGVVHDVVLAHGSGRLASAGVADDSTRHRSGMERALLELCLASIRQRGLGRYPLRQRTDHGL